MASSVLDGGSFVRIRTLNFAVEYAGIRVRETTTAAETIALVASKLRLDGAERARRKMVMVYPLAGERSRFGRARWRVRTLDADEALLPLRRAAAARLDAERASRRRFFSEQQPPTGFETDASSRSPNGNARSTGSLSRRDAGVLEPTTARDEVRFYLHDETSTPLDATELPRGEDASGSESSDDERPPQAKFVGDRQLLASKKVVVKIGTLLKRSERDPNLWRRRRCVLVDDRLYYWRETAVPAAPPPTRSVLAETSPSSSRGGPPHPRFTTPAGAQQHLQQQQQRRGSLSRDSATPKGGGKEQPDEVRCSPSRARTTAYLPEDLEYDRIVRSRAASVPLASNVVTEITGRRDVPHGVEIATAARNLVFRADSRSQQLEWLEQLKAAIESATQNEYIHLAEMIVSDEQRRRTDTALANYRKEHPAFTHGFDLLSAQQQLHPYFRRRLGLDSDFDDRGCADERSTS